MKQKIVHILSGDLWGGAEAQVLILVSELRRLGLDVEVVLFNKGFAFEQFQAANIPSHLVEEGANPLSFLKSGRDILAKQYPTLLVAHGYKEGLLAWRASKSLQIPWVATFHGLTEAYRGWKSAKMMAYQSAYRCVVCSSAARIICVSKHLAQALKFNDLDKLRVIYNASAASTQTLESGVTLENKPAVLILGRLVPVKRIDITLAAFERLVASAPAEHEAAHLYIAGEGPERESLEALVPPSLQSRVHFLGFHKQPLQLLAEADVYLLSSDSEGLPSSLLDAVALGVPAVCTAVGGIPEIKALIPDYPLELVSAGDSDGLKRELNNALKTEISPSQKAEHAKQFRGCFSAEVIAEQHSALYRELFE